MLIFYYYSALIRQNSNESKSSATYNPNNPRLLGSINGLTNSTGQKKFFCITKENNTDGSLLHMLVYAPKALTPKQILTKLTQEPDHHPHFLVTSIEGGKVILSSHGQWLENLNPSPMKKFDVSIDSQKTELKNALVKAAKTTITQWGNYNPDIAYDDALRRYQEKQKDPERTHLQKSFITAKLLTEWGVNAQTGITRVVPPLSSLRLRR